MFKNHSMKTILIVLGMWIFSIFATGCKEACKQSTKLGHDLAEVQYLMQRGEQSPQAWHEFENEFSKKRYEILSSADYLEIIMYDSFVSGQGREMKFERGYTHLDYLVRHSRHLADLLNYATLEINSWGNVNPQLSQAIHRKIVDLQYTGSGAYTLLCQ